MPVRSVPCLNHDGSRIVSGLTQDGVFDGYRNMRGHVDGAFMESHPVAFNHDGSRIVSGSDDNTVRIWNAATGITRGHVA